MVGIKRIRQFLRAFSLIETVAAISIFALLSLPILRTYRLSYRANHRATLHTQALFLAYEVRERLRRLTDYNSNNGNDSLTIPRLNIKLPDGFTFDVKSHLRSDKLFQAIINVRWQFMGKTRSTSLEALLSLRTSDSALSREGLQ